MGVKRKSRVDYSTPRKTPKKSHGGSPVEQAVRAASTYYTGSDLPGRFALGAASAIRHSAKRLFRSKPKRNPTLPKWGAKRPKMSVGNSKYSGKFGKAKRLSKKVNLYQAKGFECTTEVDGTVSDPDCVYLGASCISQNNAIDVMAYALFRQLFEKCIGIPVTNIKTQLQGYAAAGTPFANGDGFRITLSWITVSTGVESSIDYDTVPADTIYSIVGEVQAGLAGTASAIMDKFRFWATRGAVAAANTEIPMRLMIFRRDGNVGIFYVGSGSIDLRSAKVHYKSSVDFKLQNRSLSASASTDANQVDCNPLQGYLYEFKGAVPQFRNLDAATGTIRLNRMYDNGGVVLARAATMQNVNKEPPKPRFWTNCVASARVKLGPGEIKNTTLTWTTSLPLLKFLEYIGLHTEGTALFRQTSMGPGSCVMFALEDMINVNAANNIIVTYEINRTTGCYTTSTPYTVAQGVFTNLTTNDP